MEGLEISEVWLSSIVSNVETMRLDSEYHLKEFIYIDTFKRLNSHRFCKFKDLGLTIDCSAFYPGIEQFYGSGNNPLIRVQNIKDGIIDYESCTLLPELSSDYNTLKTVHEGDIVITKGGSIGFAGYVTKKAFVSRDLIFIKSSIVNSDFSKFLYLYFSTDFAFKQLIRSSSQCAQPHLTITLVKNFDILKVTDDFVHRVAKLYSDSVEKYEYSKSLYSEAENILLSELGLNNWQPNNNPINIKQLKDSYLANGRLDAEYYQVKYENYTKFIKEYKDGAEILGKVCTINDNNYNPIEDIVYKYIELSNIGNSGEITGCTNSTGYELPSRARRLVHTNDIILSSLEGSIQSVALVTDEYNNSICSTGFYVIKSNIINPETLLVLFKSEPMQNILKQGCSGTILTAIGRNELQNIVMPKIRKEVQNIIAEYIQRSILLRNEAKSLLNNAKTQVEKEIELGGGN